MERTRIQAQSEGGALFWKQAEHSNLNTLGKETRSKVQKGIMFY